jgi:signal recognition particle GTPase
MKTVLLAAGQVGLVEVGKAEDEELVEDEFEYETVEELIRDVEDETTAEDVPDVADAVEETLEEAELSTLPTQTAPLTLELLTGVPILLFM